MRGDGGERDTKLNRKRLQEKSSDSVWVKRQTTTHTNSNGSKLLRLMA